VEPGKVRTLLYNVMLIGGVSTVLFNGNPLLRFDGYYILSDWLEIPSLAQRSSRYLGYLLQRYLFGIKEAVSPVTARGERPWFVFYGIASSIYQVFILAVLVLFVSSKFFVVGILIALWAIAARIVVPVLRVSYRFYTSIGGRRRRTRVITVFLIATVAGIIVLFAVPVPMSTRTQGVVSLPEHSRIRAGTDCVIKNVLVNDGVRVKENQVVLRCEDPFLESEVWVLEANLAEAKAKYTAQPLQSRVRREILKKEITSVQADLARAMERKSQLVIRSHDRGFMVLPDGDNLPGHFVRQGTLLGYVLGETRPIATLIVSQADISLVRTHTKKVELRLADHLDRVLTAVIDREIPAASDTLPSPALGVAGGGDIPLDPSDPHHLRSLTKIFQVEVKLPADLKGIRIGQRVYVLFDHGYKPIAQQWYRRLRQLFLHRFHV
jgi:putative peptide zinc metalloprotease protein